MESWGHVLYSARLLGLPPQAETCTVGFIFAARGPPIEFIPPESPEPPVVLPIKAKVLPFIFDPLLPTFGSTPAEIPSPSNISEACLNLRDIHGRITLMLRRSHTMCTCGRRRGSPETS